MNERERKEFEAWAYSNKWNIFRVRDMGLDHYVDEFVDAAWHGWQASANREGYKLVPVDELLRKAQNIRSLNTGEYASDEIEENVCEIETMIGAVDEST